jgi:class 3 adenylate cyclase
MLPAQAEIAHAAGTAEIARAARNELAEIADQIPSAAIRAAREWAAGLLGLLEGETGRAIEHLREASKRWSDVGMPFEAAKARVVLAGALQADGDDGAAAREVDLARAAFERLGSRSETLRATELRARFAGGLPSTRAVRTFVFTDIVGSTSLIAAIGDDAWEDLRRWHDQTLRAAFVQHGGEEIDHAGDGFFVAFPTVGSAVACAVQIQQRLREHRRTHGFAPQVRIGLHATAATHEEDGYTGLGVHAAARIGALAGAGEILASAETMAGIGSVRTTDPRTVELKGIGEPVRVVAIDWRSAAGG